MTQQQAAFLSGRTFFPELIAGPFQAGLGLALGFAAAACLVAVLASGLRGGKYHHAELQPEGAQA